MGWLRPDPPTWRDVKEPGGNARRHPGFDRMMVRVEREEAARRQEIADAHKMRRELGGLHELTDRELRHIGLVRTRGLFGGTRIEPHVPTPKYPHGVHLDKHNEAGIARRQAKIDRREKAKDYAKKKAKQAWYGSNPKPKTKMFYWGEGNKYK